MREHKETKRIFLTCLLRYFFILTYKFYYILIGFNTLKKSIKEKSK